MKWILFIGLSTFLLLACGKDVANSTVTNKPIPVPSPSVSKEEQAKLDKEYSDKQKTEQVNAVDDFISKFHKGWKLLGTETGLASCDVDLPCNLHISNGNQEKVIAVMLKQFERTDGSTYWFAFEARPIDLLKSKLDSIRQGEIESTLASLTFEQCESVFDRWRDAQASYEPFEESGPTFHNPRN